MADLTNAQRTALTRLGAQARLAELMAESDAILHAFPDLATPAKNIRSKAAPLPAPKARKRYRMSAANRKAAADRMRAFWAAKRGAAQQAPVASANEKPAARSPRKRRAKKAR